MLIRKRSLFGIHNEITIAKLKDNNYQIQHYDTLLIFNNNDFPLTDKQYMFVNENYRIEDYGDHFELFRDNQEPKSTMLLLSEDNITYGTPYRYCISFI